MIQEEKDLVLRDLCGRLPYGVIVSPIDCGKAKLIGFKDDHPILFNLVSQKEYDKPWEIEYIKPYLRPMSSMTEGEKREIYDWLVENDVDWFDFSKLRLDEILISFDSSWLLINWLNAHYFDYRGLIPKGLQ